MSDETVISDLVARAEDLRAGGTEPDLTALCACAPHLLPEVRDRLNRLAASVKTGTDRGRLMP